jgi:hypothetical protein
MFNRKMKEASQVALIWLVVLAFAFLVLLKAKFLFHH